MRTRDNDLIFFKFCIKKNHSEFYGNLINENADKISDKEKNNNSNHDNYIIDNNKKEMNGKQIQNTNVN